MSTVVSCLQDAQVPSSGVPVVRSIRSQPMAVWGYAEYPASIATGLEGAKNVLAVFGDRVLRSEELGMPFIAWVTDHFGGVKLQTGLHLDLLPCHFKSLHSSLDGCLDDAP